MNKKLLIIITIIVFCIAAIAIAIPIILHNSQTENVNNQEQLSFDKTFDDIYELYVDDGKDGVVNADAYTHIEGLYDLEIGVNFVSDTLLSKSEVMIGKEEQGVVSLYIYTDGHWKYKTNEPVSASSYAMHVAKYLARTDKLLAKSVVSPTQDIFPSYTYLSYGGCRIYAL